MPFEIFRSRATIQAIYFDGSLESALELCRSFPYIVSLELDTVGKPMVRVRDQAAILKEHTWCYSNDGGRLEWRDTKELGLKWEKIAGAPLQTSNGKKPATRKRR